MIKIIFKGKEYLISKDKIKFVLEKLNNSNIKDNEILELMEKFHLYDEWFLENISL